MARLPRQCDRTLEQTALQQFSTPPTLAYLAARIYIHNRAARYWNRQQEPEASPFGASGQSNNLKLLTCRVFDDKRRLH